MTDLDILMEKLRQHLFGSGEFTKDDLYRLYDICADSYTKDDVDRAFENGYDEGFEDGVKHGRSGDED